MKKIINGKRYDTATATERNYWENSFERTDFQWCRETLYQKKTGEFFLYGEGGPMSQYAEPIGNSGWTGGERIMPISYKEAQKWAEEHLTGDEYEAIFGDVSEDGGEKTVITISLPVAIVDKLKRLAAQTGNTQSDIVAEMIREA